MGSWRASGETLKKPEWAWHGTGVSWKRIHLKEGTRPDDLDLGANVHVSERTGVLNRTSMLLVSGSFLSTHLGPMGSKSWSLGSSTEHMKKKRKSVPMFSSIPLQVTVHHQGLVPQGAILVRLLGQKLSEDLKLQVANRQHLRYLPCMGDTHRCRAVVSNWVAVELPEPESDVTVTTDIPTEQSVVIGRVETWLGGHPWMGMTWFFGSIHFLRRTPRIT